MKNKKLILLLLFGMIFLFGIIISVHAFDWGDGILSYYNLDESSATDSLGNYNATSHSLTTGVGGIINNAFNFSDTGGSYAESAAFPSFAYTDNFSISIWINPASTPTNAFIAFGKAAGVFAFTGYMQSGGTLHVQTKTNAGGATLLTGGVASAGNWYHIVATYNGATKNFTMYENGVQVDSATSTSTASQGSSLSIRSDYDSGSVIQNWNGKIDEVAIFNYILSNAEVSDLYNSGNGLGYKPTAESIVLNSPTQNFDTTLTDTIFNITAIAQSNVTNVSLFVDGDLKQTNSSGYNGTYLFYETLGFGNHTWLISGFIDGNYTNSSSQNFSISKIVVNNVTYSSSTIEGTTEQFIINFTKTSSLQVSTINLIYNGTTYSSYYSVNDNIIIGTNNVAIPNVDANSNATFYWSIMLSDGTIINTTSYNQTINLLAIDYCSAYSGMILNFTLYDEKTQLKLINSTYIDVQINIYDKLRTLSILNFSHSYNNTNPATICINTPLFTSTNYSLDSVVKYTANNYAIEYYNLLNFTLSNSSVPRNIKLYSLNIDDSTEFQLTFKDKYLSFYPDILVYVYRQYVSDNDFKVVEIPLTDSNGQTILHLVRNDAIYNLIMVDSTGKIVASFNHLIAFCQDYTIGSCTINLNARTSEDQVYSYNDDVKVSYSISYSNATKLISFNFVSTDLETKSMRIDVMRNSDFGNRTICSESLISSSGIINCNVSSITDTDRFLFINIYENNNLIGTETIDLQANTKGFGANGVFIAFLFILLIICLFMEDKQTLVIMLVLGWIIILAFGLIKGALIGIVSGGIWLIITAIIFLWKLKKEELG